MAEFPKMKVSKLDAARRQLDCAIRLWINDDDPVSIHTLAFAAFEIINDLNAKRGNKAVTLQGLTETLAKPGHLTEVMGYMKKPMTFFKHSNRDPLAILEFAPEVNEYVFLFAANGLKELGEQLTDLQHTFVQWMLVHHPNLIKKGQTAFPEFGDKEVQAVATMRAVTKRQFFDTFLSGIAAKRTAKLP
jgi:hypothetical protein